jgi:hypothetical protein
MGALEDAGEFCVSVSFGYAARMTSNPALALKVGTGLIVAMMVCWAFARQIYAWRKEDAEPCAHQYHID